jgi:long-chain acyl-CoA synthetase
MPTPEFQSVAEMVLWRCDASPDADAFGKPDGNGGWKRYNWRQIGDLVKDLSCGLRALDLQPEERVAILSGTRLEWILADLGILCAAGATTTIYPSSTAQESAYILKDSKTVMIFCEDEAQTKKILSVRGELPALRHIVTFDGPATDDGFVLTLAALTKLGQEEHGRDRHAYERVAKSVKKDQLATLIYTSGTTGVPKGVELTQDNWLYEGECIDSLGLMGVDDVQYFWLPLAHSFGKVLEMSQIRIGFYTAIDGRIDKIVENLGDVKPTFMCGVPRIFEKVYNKVVATAKEKGGMSWKIFNWSLAVGSEASKLRQQGQEPGGFLGFKYSIADRLVFSTLRDRFGGRIKFFISGSAPLSREMAEFFHAAGLLILEGYGLTETSAASFVNRPDKYRFGSVGYPLPGTEVKIAEADGEILIKGRGVMRGYHNMPEATAETLKDGWLLTGDIGEVNDGFLRITDRKKDLIKTSGGKYVAPQMVEGKLKAHCPFVSQVVVHGDNRNFCTALIALDPEAITKWAKDNELDGKSYAELAADPKVTALIQPYIDALNKELPSYETLKKFALLPKDLSVEEGELTPSLKLKRKVVEKKYKALLDGFYSGAMEK